jgi:formylglycine-generating enzyme required for sulfatase activity
MMRFSFVFLFLLSVQVLLSQPYPVPESIRTKYYYQPGDSLLLSEKPIPALLKILKGWNYLPSDSTRVEPADGHDTIFSLYHYDYQAKQGGFLYLPTEVSNFAYRKFVRSSGNPAFTPDTNCWLSSKRYSEPFSHYYFQHPAYNNFPVVGVSFIQAKAYCQWLQDSINRILTDKKIPQRVEVDLPSSDEWINLYYYATRRFERKNKRKTIKPTYLQFASPGNQNNVISGPWYSARFSYIKPLQTDFIYTTEVNGVSDIGGIHHLMGNVAEWTRSSARNHLFNHKEYIYTVTGRLAPNVYENHPQGTLDKYIRGDNLNPLMAIKGGSWLDDPYFLQPGALYFQDQRQGQPNIGFRPIIRVVKP